MSLNTIWFILFIVIITGYLILDGFDMGVGILHMFVAKNDNERRININTIGPIWDGNEVWLVLGGGALFAAFPIVYASLFSGFYPAMMLVLMVLILRPVAIEFRSKQESGRWRTVWDMMFFLTSLLLALLLGVALGNIISGVPLNEEGNIVINNIFDLLKPFDLLLGLTTVAMMAMHGALYINLKTEGELQARVRGFMPKLMGAFAVTAVLSAIFMLVAQFEPVAIYAQIWPLIFPLVAAICFGLIPFFLKRGQEFLAFVASSGMILFLMLSVAVGMFPNLLISNMNQQYNLTITNAASQANTLTVMLIIAVIGMPFVLLYTAGVYYIFRGKVVLEADSY
ncbi:MAG: cytochrome d ubiquinol oxidase subunit II [Anaerolineae bacterium]|nr:cytochrome d ubiquinol oxidase subunit II [Anaerolineae bacterium]